MEFADGNKPVTERSIGLICILHAKVRKTSQLAQLDLNRSGIAWVRKALGGTDDFGDLDGLVTRMKRGGRLIQYW